MTAAGIARLAGVGRAAVSNWRRRHADFPKPVGGTETSPSFALAEVERWLRDQGKLAEVPPRERVWRDLSADPSGAADALIRTGCVLLFVRDRPEEWRQLAAVPDARLAQLLPAALEQVLAPRLGEPGERAVPSPTPQQLLPSVPLLRAAAALAAELGVRETFEFLLGRYLDTNPRQYSLTPPEAASLMAALADAAGEDAHGTAVLDPAAGAGALLRAVARPALVYAQESAPELAALTGLRLALHTDARVTARAGDSLRADAHPRLAADVVLCHPPFNERNWGHDELAYDPRWEYGFPARTESELAWVQHALARLRPGGTAVLLMPPAAASRRSGRRIRADLLRRGALRAVVALPAGAAPPYGIPLHLWVLRRPGGDARPSTRLLFVDTAEPTEGGGGRDKLDWTAVAATALDAWHPFDRRGTAEEMPGVSRAVSVIELLDDDVDLTPARHLPPAATRGGPAELARLREQLADTLVRTGRLSPPVTVPAESAAPASPLTTTVAELARAGALVLHAGGTGTTTAGSPVPVLTEQDVFAGRGPSGTLPEGPADGPADGVADEPVRIEAGDVVLPVLGGGRVTRVADADVAGAALGRNLQLLRPDPAALDPWFLAGFLRATANHRQASSYASTATRLDVRRLQLPRLALADQRRYGERFRSLAAFEDALRLAGRLGEQLVQGMYDGLTDGSVAPD
ncbi:SAM-dependent methyltransferase [Streptomyces corynorhini]|uniref:SAM-dependent methyltransferase n=1 Tax=Streptomyces corynorhini TaxID=2282652 RepID=A0A370BB11_9ACTN|nr:SAM-dependent methyltransferase [Streptomyces corynorhini]